eukprot:scaffold300900_cov26-Tisochrysis_lutea.AAC.3
MERANHQKVLLGQDEPLPGGAGCAQRALDSEKAAHAAAKARIKATHSSLSAAAAAADVDAVASSSCSSPSVSDSATAREAAVAREHLARESLAAAREMTTTIEGLRAELAASQARETQAKSKLAHATAERQKDKAKLERCGIPNTSTRAGALEREWAPPRRGQVLSNQRLKESEWMSERTEAMRRSGYLQVHMLPARQCRCKFLSPFACSSTMRHRPRVVSITAKPVACGVLGGGAWRAWIDT